ncbi:hypothetical protein D3C87_1430050 [compost metagenome]
MGAIRFSDPWFEPVQQLPVAADPAGPACNIGEIVVRVLLVEQHFAQQPRAGVTSFQQIMAEDQVFRAGVVRGLHKNIDIVNAFPDKRSFVEQILIDIRRHHRIGIIPGDAAAHGGIAPLAVARHLFGEARLQNAVAFHHALAGGVIFRFVQWVRHGGDQLMRRVAWQKGVAVESDDVLDPLRQLVRRQVGDAGKLFVRLA